MDFPTIHVVDDGDDWVAVYADDRLIQQGHSVRWDELLESLGIPYTQETASQQAYEELVFPGKYSKVTPDES